MRRRTATPTVAHLSPFEAPRGDVHAVWAAFVAWEAELDAWAAQHPDDRPAIEAVRDRSTVPDQPWDGSDL